MLAKQVLRALWFPLVFLWELFFSKKPQLERIQLKKSNLPKIVHLSDFHFNVHPNKQQWYQQLQIAHLEHVVQVVNQENPQVIVMTGDFVQHDAICIEGFVAFVKQFKCKHIFATMGNHDLKQDKRKIIEALESAGVTVLDGTSIIHQNVEYVGFLDYYDSQFNTVYAKQTQQLAQTKNAACRIILSHNPDTHTRILQDNWQCDLILCGHSHGGQVCVYLPKPLMWWLPAHTRLECANQFWVRYPVIPLLNALINVFPAIVRIVCAKSPLGGRLLCVVKHWQYAIGLSKLPNDSYLYTHRGIGTHFPFRFLCPPEITVFE